MTTPSSCRATGLRRFGAVLCALGLSVAARAPLAGQSLEDASRLAGLETVGVRAEAAWDELITMEAGGATSDQFLQALEATFGDAIGNADAGPEVGDGGTASVACHVDTFYETGLIVYALRVQVERPGDDGRPVIIWIRSWVGSFTVQQLHLMFSLGEQCAEAFLEAWRSAN
jgi:hypothetical protein